MSDYPTLDALKVTTRKQLRQYEAAVEAENAEATRLTMEIFDIHPGDRIIDRKEREYEVTRVTGDHFPRSAKLYGNPIKKDGTPGSREVPIWRTWTKL